MKKVEAITTLLFDYGHTIVDLVPADGAVSRSYEAMWKLLAPYGAGCLTTPEEMARLVHRRLNRLIDSSYESGVLEEIDLAAEFSSALADIGLAPSPEVLDRALELEHDIWSSSQVYTPEMEEVLAGLRQRGFKTGIVSNNAHLPEIVLADMERLGVLRHFDAVGLSSQIGVRKPHPAIYKVVLEKLGSSPREVLFVGDRLREDVRGPRALGMAAVLTHQFRQEQPEEGEEVPIVSHLRELLSCPLLNARQPSSAACARGGPQRPRCA